MLVDVNVSFGGREGIQTFPLDRMLQQLSHYPCSAAFVHCNQGVTDHAAANEQTLMLCAGQERLLPAAVIQPRSTLSWEREVERCLAAGVRLFRLFPDRTKPPWPIESVYFERIVERLSGTDACLLIDAVVPGIATQAAARTAGSGVSVIFSELRYHPMGEALLVGQRYPHVYLESSRLTSPEAVEICVAELGADRILFGSGAARYPAWVAWQTIERSALTARERELIYHGNAERLFGRDFGPVSEEDHERTLTASRTASMPIIDSHLHDKIPGIPVKSYAPAEFDSILLEQGVERGICSSGTAIFYDLAQGNDELLAFIEDVPRLFGYIVVDPRYLPESVIELERFATHPKFVGVKVHAAAAQTSTGSAEMRRLFDILAPYQKPVLIHNLGPDWPEALVALARAHPELPIIAAHAGYGDGIRPTHDAVLRLQEAENIAVDFCSTFLPVGAIRRGIDVLGVQRVLFGSDFPQIGLPYMRACYEDAELTEDEQRTIHYMNAQALFWGTATPLAAEGT